MRDELEELLALVDPEGGETRPELEELLREQERQLALESARSGEWPEDADKGRPKLGEGSGDAHRGRPELAGRPQDGSVKPGLDVFGPETAGPSGNSEAVKEAAMTEDVPDAGLLAAAVAGRAGAAGGRRGPVARAWRAEDSAVPEGERTALSAETGNARILRERAEQISRAARAALWLGEVGDAAAGAGGSAYRESRSGRASLEIRQVDRAFERDARRYDGAFTLY